MLILHLSQHNIEVPEKTQNIAVAAGIATIYVATCATLIYMWFII